MSKKTYTNISIPIRRLFVPGDPSFPFIKLELWGEGGTGAMNLSRRCFRGTAYTTDTPNGGAGSIAFFTFAFDFQVRVLACVCTHILFTIFVATHVNASHASLRLALHAFLCSYRSPPSASHAETPSKVNAQCTHNNINILSAYPPTPFLNVLTWSPTDRWFDHPLLTCSVSISDFHA